MEGIIINRVLDNRLQNLGYIKQSQLGQIQTPKVYVNVTPPPGTKMSVSASPNVALGTNMQTPAQNSSVGGNIDIVA